ncbi:MAG: GerMN domain-containing protein [Candidatus Omnitrophica bacterium]|nr:GerMN domain-containing protein [Candidatus Omnitrophota bacterium]
MKKNENIVFIILSFILLVLLLFWGFLKIRGKILKETSVYVFFVTQKDNQIYLLPVKRQIGYCRNFKNKIAMTIKELLKGPTEEEKKEGFSTFLNENTKLLNVTIEEDMVNLDFSKEVEEGGGTLTMETRIAQIVCSATQFPEIKKVRFLIEGKPINYFSGEGITIVEKPISRDDLKEFDIKIKEEEEK